MENTTYETITQMFQEMLEIEVNMDNTYLEMIQNVRNKEIKEILEYIRDDEHKHEHNVSEILKILKY